MKLTTLALPAFVAMATTAFAADGTVKLLTVDPGHFHAALVQKSMYPQVSPEVHVYAPAGPDLDLHLKRIEGFNTRAEQPTSWKTTVHTSPDFFEKMLADRSGNVVVLAGNNALKTDYILRCVEAGLNVLADKPMVITPENYPKLQRAFEVAKKKNVLLYDIMTERHEITTELQRELSLIPSLYGKQLKGDAAQPAVTKESVHHYFKYVSGKPLIRPPWFFDVRQQGEGIVDVTTHLVDLIQWEVFPEKVLKPSDVKILSARRWPTRVTLAQFEQATGLKSFPDYLKSSVNAAGELEVYGNGEFTYALRGVVSKVSVTWNFQAPEGAGDTHYSIMRGSKVSLVIKQGAEQKYKPTLYITPVAGGKEFGAEVQKAVAKLQKNFPGIAAQPSGDGFEVTIPDKYKVGHEAHFAQVTEAYLKYLAAGKLPAWEVPNMLVKYQTIMQAYEKSR
jgi:predicted dehydrogenase